MFELLLSSASPNSRTSQFPRLWQWGGAQKAVGQHGQESWPKLAKGKFHSTGHHSQDISWGNWLGGANCCIMHHLFPSVLFPFHYNYYYILFCFNHQTVLTPLMLPYPAHTPSVQQEFGTGTVPHLPCHHFIESQLSLLEALHFPYSNGVLQGTSIIQRAEGTFSFVWSEVIPPDIDWLWMFDFLPGKQAYINIMHSQGRSCYQAFPNNPGDARREPRVSLCTNTYIKILFPTQYFMQRIFLCISGWK